MTVPTTPAPALDAPRSPYRRTKATRSNYELYGWIFMRLSGVILLVLVFGHLVVNLVGNLVAFLPMGLIPPLILRRRVTARQVALVAVHGVLQCNHGHITMCNGEVSPAVH